MEGNPFDRLALPLPEPASPAHAALLQASGCRAPILYLWPRPPPGPGAGGAGSGDADGVGALAAAAALLLPPAGGLVPPPRPAGATLLAVCAAAGPEDLTNVARGLLAAAEGDDGAAPAVTPASLFVLRGMVRGALAGLAASAGAAGAAAALAGGEGGGEGAGGGGGGGGDGGLPPALVALAQHRRWFEAAVGSVASELGCVPAA
jgi:hypothetical protein